MFPFRKKKMPFQTKPLKGNPQVLDEIIGDVQYMHIERNSKHEYWMFIKVDEETERTFFFRTAAGKGPGIVMVQSRFG